MSLSQRYEKLMNQIPEHHQRFEQQDDVPEDYIDCASNDYLSLARNPIHREYTQQYVKNLSSSASASRLLKGYHATHHLLEKKSEIFWQAPPDSALLFGSGYAAALGILSTLPQKNDVILLDSQIHTCWKDASRLSLAKFFKFFHNNREDLEKKLEHYRQHTIWIVVESLYSMDGSYAPLEDILTLANAYNAYLIIDEAHSVGTTGSYGKGLSFSLPRTQTHSVITVYPCGKALASCGAIVLAPPSVRHYLVNRSRPFIYSTALPPIVSCTTLASLEFLEKNPSHPEKLNPLRTLASHLFSHSHASHIVPYPTNSPEQANALTRYLADHKILVSSIRPPTVPQNQSQLRISLHTDLPETQLHTIYSLLQSYPKQT